MQTSFCKEQIIDAILKGELAEGDALPSMGNVELLRDSKRYMIEKKMQELIDTAKTLNITKEELNAMMDILFEED